MTLDCNGLEFDVCINAEDLMGEPEIGRRLKASIWLQGRMNFEEIESIQNLAKKQGKTISLSFSLFFILNNITSPAGIEPTTRAQEALIISI